MAETTRVSRECPENLVELVRQAQDGSVEAARVLMERCREPLLGVIRGVLFQPLRRLFDSTDFLLETFEKIFTMHFTDEVLSSPERLWPYIQRIAGNKVRDAGRKYLRSERHDLRRDVALEELNLEEEELVSTDLSPEEIFMLKELVEEELDDFIAQLANAPGSPENTTRTRIVDLSRTVASRER